MQQLLMTSFDKLTTEAIGGGWLQKIDEQDNNLIVYIVHHFVIVHHNIWMWECLRIGDLINNVVTILFEGCYVKWLISRIFDASILSFIEIGKLRPTWKQPKMATKPTFIVSNFYRIEVLDQIVLSSKANRDAMEDKW